MAAGCLAPSGRPFSLPLRQETFTSPASSLRKQQGWKRLPALPSVPRLGFGDLGRSWEPGLGCRHGDLGRFEGDCPETGSLGGRRAEDGCLNGQRCRR